MSELFAIVTDMIEFFMELLKNMINILINNPIFQLILGIVILDIVVKLVLRLVEYIKVEKYYTRDSVKNSYQQYYFSKTGKIIREEDINLSNWEIHNIVKNTKYKL